MFSLMAVSVSITFNQELELEMFLKAHVVKPGSSLSLSCVWVPMCFLKEPPVKTFVFADDKYSAEGSSLSRSIPKRRRAEKVKD
jgi:hypothetical protein